MRVGEKFRSVVRSNTRIHVRLIVVSSLLLTLVVGLFGGLNTIATRRIIDASSKRLSEKIQDSLRQAGMAQLNLLADAALIAISQGDYTTLQSMIFKMRRNDRRITEVSVVDAAKRVLAHTEAQMKGAVARDYLAVDLPPGTMWIKKGVMAGGRSSISFALAVERETVHICTVFLAYSLVPLEAEMAKAAQLKRKEAWSVLRQTILVGAFTLLLGVLLTVFQGLRISRPIQDLARQADRIAQGDLRARAKVQSGDEVGILAARFNHMAEQLESTIIELKNAQSQLIHSERMAGLGILVAGVAHEINTPVGAIKGSAEMLGRTLERLVNRLVLLAQSDLSAQENSAFLERIMVRLHNSLSDPQRRSPTELHREAKTLALELLPDQPRNSKRLAKRLLAAGAGDMAPQISQLATKVSPDLLVGIAEDLSFLERSSSSIQGASSSLAQLVRALKSYSRIEQEPMAEVDVHEGIEDTLTILSYYLQGGVKITKSLTPVPKISAYVNELNQVWTNLIYNSVQAMGEAGEMTIETGQQEHFVFVRITDDGVGIPQDVLPRIFEPFFTTKTAGEGSGLGLDIAQQIIAKHGGRIEVESRPGRTSFLVLLPIEGEAAPGVPSATLRPAVNG